MTAENVSESVDRVTEIAGRVAEATEEVESASHWRTPYVTTTNAAILLERLRTAEAERDEAVKEMHARELHHFESEVELEVLTAELVTVKQQRSDNLRAIAERDAVIAGVAKADIWDEGYRMYARGGTNPYRAGADQ